MYKKVFWTIKILLILIMLATAYYVYPFMPDTFPTHWNFEGKIDGYSSKEFGLFFIPVLTLIIAVAMPLFQKIDPRKESFKQFEKSWEVLQLGLVTFFAYIFYVMLYVIQHPSGVSMNTFMMMGIGILFVLLGNYMGKIRQNYTVGIRVPWTIDNEEVWNKTHRLGGWCFVVSGLIFIINAYFNWMVWLVFIVSMVIAVIVPIAYSYILHKQL